MTPVATSPVATRSSRLLLLLVVIVTCIALDRLTKEIAVSRLRPIAPMSFLGDTVRIQYAENPGAFLGWGGSLSDSTRFLLLIVVNAVMLIVVAGVLLFRWNMHRVPFTALALVLGGGVGNLIDRLFQDGMVIDFVNLGIGPVRTGIFNVADVAITGGSILIAVWSFRGDPQPSSAQPSIASGVESRQA